MKKASSLELHKKGRNYPCNNCTFRYLRYSEITTDFSIFNQKCDICAEGRWEKFRRGNANFKIGLARKRTSFSTER